MSIFSSLFTGVSGMRSNERGFSVIGDNIANVNTVGYRKSRAMFEDFLSRSLLGVGEVGGGSRLASIDKIFMQGAIVASERPTDMAITSAGDIFVTDGYGNRRIVHLDKEGHRGSSGNERGIDRTYSDARERGLDRRRPAALALDDLHDLLRGLPVGQRLDADVGHEVAGDLAGVQRVLLRYFERARRRLRFEPSGPHDRVVQAGSSEILLGDDLFI